MLLQNLPLYGTLSNKEIKFCVENRYFDIFVKTGNNSGTLFDRLGWSKLCDDKMTKANIKIYHNEFFYVMIDKRNIVTWASTINEFALLYSKTRYESEHCFLQKSIFVCTNINPVKVDLFL